MPAAALASNQSMEAPPLEVSAGRGVVLASGSLLLSLHEEQIQRRPLEITLTLRGDAWHADLETKLAHLLIAGLRSGGGSSSSSSSSSSTTSSDSDDTAAQSHGWDAEVLPAMRTTHITRIDDLRARIVLPAVASYDIAAPETIVLRIPAETVRSNQPLTVEPALLVLPTPGVVHFDGGSLIDAATGSVGEGAVRSDATRTLRLRLDGNDTWTDAMLAHDLGGGASSALRRGLRSDVLAEAAQVAPYGWDAVVQPGLRHSHWALDTPVVGFDAATNRSIHGLDRSVAVLSLPQFAQYDLTRPEVLELAVPPGAVASNQRVRASGSLRVDASVGYATLDGTLLATPTEAALRSSDTLHLDVALRGDTWARGVGDDTPATRALLAGLRSGQGEPYGWNAAVLPRLDSRAVRRISDTAIQIELRQAAHYEISEPELIQLAIPAEAVTSDLPIVASPQVVLKATPGAAAMAGGFATAPTESAIRGGAAAVAAFDHARYIYNDVGIALRHAEGAQAHPGDLELTLARDAWSPAVLRAAADPSGATERAVVAQLAAGLQSEQSELSGWNAVVVPLLQCCANVSLVGVGGGEVGVAGDAGGRGK